MFVLPFEGFYLLPEILEQVNQSARVFLLASDFPRPPFSLPSISSLDSLSPPSAQTV